jgi:hypothetical protein
MSAYHLNAKRNAQNNLNCYNNIDYTTRIDRIDEKLFQMDVKINEVDSQLNDIDDKLALVEKQLMEIVKNQKKTLIL